MPVSRTVRLSSKGQLVIPQEIRDELGLKPGDALVLHSLSERLLLAEVPPRSPFRQAVEELRREAAAKGLTPADVERAVAEVRVKP